MLLLLPHHLRTRMTRLSRRDHHHPRRCRLLHPVMMMMVLTLLRLPDVAHGAHHVLHRLVGIPSRRDRHLPRLLPPRLLKFLLHLLPHAQCILPQGLTRLVPRLLVADVVPHVAVGILREESSRGIEIAHLVDDGGCDEAFFSFESRREVDPFFPFDEFAVLFVARVGVDGAAAAAEDVVVVWGGGVGHRGGGDEWLVHLFRFLCLFVFCVSIGFSWCEL
mmetsp:Transcript_3367/g.7378  ORF Transcript_3367/g.7378 Transcript_3367/m.7378 type:complete len:220 (+) Transcript_3367:327-986(+)